MEQKKKLQDRIKTVRIVDQDGNELKREDINFDEVDFKADGKGTVTVINKVDEDIIYYDDGFHWDNDKSASFFVIPKEENRFYTIKKDDYVLVNNYGEKYKIFYSTDKEYDEILSLLEERSTTIEKMCTNKGYNYVYLGLVYEDGVTYDSMYNKHIERKKRR